MVSILFFIKRKKLLKDGTASIFARVTFNRLSAEVDGNTLDSVYRKQLE